VPVLWSLYVYAPNKVAPVIFTVAVSASVLYRNQTSYLPRARHSESCKMIGLHPLCAVLYTAGYALPEYGANNYLYSNQNLIIYIVSQYDIHMPVSYSMQQKRCLFYGPHCAPLPPGRVLSTIGGLVALAELLNGLGVAFTSIPSSSQCAQQMGSNLTIASLATQFCVIPSCVIVGSIFHWRCIKSNIRTKAVSISLITLYVSMSLISIRCVYRRV
ncbi:hypothetical protein BDV97DRAFT_405798, partial [Delphinella strobiligena]